MFSLKASFIENSSAHSRIVRRQAYPPCILARSSAMMRTSCPFGGSVGSSSSNMSSMCSSEPCASAASSASSLSSPFTGSALAPDSLHIRLHIHCRRLQRRRTFTEDSKERRRCTSACTPSRPTITQVRFWTCLAEEIRALNGMGCARCRNSQWFFLLRSGWMAKARKRRFARCVAAPLAVTHRAARPRRGH